MKNLLYLAAIAATTVGITSCSSDEDLSNTAKDSGVPFKVTATAPTRATDLTSSNFTNFQLYAFEGNTEWISGAQFTKNTSLWAPAKANETYNWPHADVPSNFYAVSENGTSMSSAFVDDIANSQSFTYTVPTTVADQKDLLVASTIGGKSTDAQVALAFKHALANATLTLKLDPSYSKTYGPEAGTTVYRLATKIQKISICNVKTVGKYNFSTSTWSDQATYGTYTMDFSSSPLIIDTDRNTTKTITVNVDGSNGKLFFIPQNISYWNITANDPATTTETTMTNVPTDKTYILLKAITMAYVPSDVLAYCQGKSLTLTDGIYYDGTKAVATSDGQVLDFSNAGLNAEQFPYIETYNQTATADGTFADFDNSALFGELYKPFKPSNSNVELLGNYTHNITLEVVNAVRKDASGAFGTGADVHGAKIR